MLHILTESNSIRDIIVSQDRFTIYRATISDDPNIDAQIFTTGAANLHLDLNPWWWQEDAIEIKGGLCTLTYEDEQDFIKENNMVVSSMGRYSYTIHRQLTILI